jgi:Cu+-exporting ATPase
MQVKEPVCGMMIDDQSAEVRSTYQGNTFYFCSTECKEMFDDDPARYAVEEEAGVGGE